MKLPNVVLFVCLGTFFAAYGLNRVYVDASGVIRFFEQVVHFCAAQPGDIRSAIYDDLWCMHGEMNDSINYFTKQVLLVIRNMHGHELTQLQRDQAIHMLCSLMGNVCHYISRGNQKKYLAQFELLVDQLSDNERKQAIRGALEISLLYKYRRRVRPYKPSLHE